MPLIILLLYCHELKPKFPSAYRKGTRSICLSVHAIIRLLFVAGVIRMSVYDDYGVVYVNRRQLS